MNLQPIQVGLDIGARTLRAAWQVSSNGKPAEWRYATVARPADPRAEALRERLAVLLAPLRRARFRARLVLAASDSTVRRCAIRATEAARISDTIRQQLPSLLPFEVQHASYRYMVRTQQPVDGGLECELLLAACESQALHRELRPLWELGWAPQAVLPKALALLQAARALTLLSPDPMMLVDVGDDRTTMALIHQEEVVYARDVTLGTMHLADALMGQVSLGTGALSLTQEQAEAALRTAGLSPAADQGGMGPLPLTTYLAMLQPVLEQLVNEMRRTMAYGTQAVAMPAPTRLLISGEGARLPGAQQWMAAQLALPVACLDCQPWLNEARPDVAVACGLALTPLPSDLDLQPVEAKRRAVVAQGTGWLWRAQLALLLVVLGATGWWNWRHRSLAREVQALTVRWEGLQPVTALQEAVEAHRGLAQRLTVTESLPPEWFRRLALEFPNALRLRSLTVDPDRRAVMTGEAQARERAPEAAIQSFTLEVEQAALCRDVQLQSTRRLQADGSVVEFSLACQIP